MKKKRTAAYRFRVSTETGKFRRAYEDELGRLRLAYRITELREKCGLTQAQLAERHKPAYLVWRIPTIGTTR